jgi:hypothetical protein
MNRILEAGAVVRGGASLLLGSGGIVAFGLLFRSQMVFLGNRF